MVKLGFIGSGNMAFALAKAFKDNSLVRKEDIVMSDKDLARLKFVKKYFKTTTNNVDVINSDVIFICVKPSLVSLVLEEIKPFIKNQIIVSVAAGIKIKSMQKVIPRAKIVRAMPNILCLVNELSSAYSCSKFCSKKDASLVSKLFNGVGVSIEIEESRIDAVTVISGSAPAFFAFILNAFVEAGIKEGLKKEEARVLAYNVLAGTGKYLRDYKKDPEQLVKEVMSSKGTTYAGIEEMKKQKLDKGMQKVFKASLKRSKELGKE